MSYREALAWLFGTQRFGIKLGLENIRQLLAALDVPAPEQRIIHVAGTNGKGSVCAMLDSILRSANFRTGLFISPHLITFRERIRVNGEMIDETSVARGLTTLRELLRSYQPHPTFFEIVTALALTHFKQMRCEIIVLETGLGGRLDATNAVQPVVSVITSIDFDHQKWLGNSLAEIASEKAGIIKFRTPVVSALQQPDVTRVLQTRAVECEAPIEFVAPKADLQSNLFGEHQAQNAALAVAALQACGFEIADNDLRAGLKNVTWPARFQFWDDRTVIDGAHNPAGARVLGKSWRQKFGERKATLILAVLEDKEVEKICDELAPIANRVLLPQIRTLRSLSPRRLQEILQARAPTLPTTICPSFSEAWNEAEQLADPILIAGSLHFAGEALAALQGLPAAFEECAQ